MEVTTLCYIEKEDSYLMLYRNKKEKDINQGKWIGVGGHLEAGESIEECLLREVYEETGLTLLDYKLRGEIVFYIDDLIETSFLFTSDSFEGDIKECDEGILKWIKKDDVLSLNLWEADPLFLNIILKGESFKKMTLVYKDDKLISYKVER